MGTRQNLFADGQARVTSDEAAIEAALAYPDVPQQRAVGPMTRFSWSRPSSRTCPTLQNALLGNQLRKRSLSQSRPIGLRLMARRRRYVIWMRGRKREEAEFERRQATLEVEIAEARRNCARRWEAAVRLVAKAKDAYRRAQ
jgi:hypothetical protein